MLTPRFFNEFAVRLPKPAAAVVEALAAQDIIAGVPFSRLDPDAGLDDVLLVCATETTTDADIAAFAEALWPRSSPDDRRQPSAGPPGPKPRRRGAEPDAGAAASCRTSR